MQEEFQGDLQDGLSVYSYHTFLFPFIWNGSGKESMEKFEKAINTSTHWIRTDWGNDKGWTVNRDKLPGSLQEDKFIAYSRYQYFTDPARDLIFGAGGNVVHNFSFAPEDLQIKNNASYVIKKDSECFKLSINAITLKIVDTGVAVMAYELEYYGLKNINGKTQISREIDDVYKINEYGRRIFLPYLTMGNHAVAADKVELRINLSESKKSICYKPREYLDSLKNDSNDFYNKLSLSHVTNIVKDVIMFGKDDIKSHELKKRYIKPIIDDRMFVCCIVCDPNLSNELKSFDDKTGDYLYLSDYKEKQLDENSNDTQQSLSSKLYSLMYVDVSPEYASCQSRVMRRQILKNSIYDRWIEYGTIYGVSHHAFTCVTGDPQEFPSITEIVINPFLTQYVELVKIALIQRATILAFSKHASDLANGFSGDGIASEITLNKIRTLSERYAKAHNQVFLFEVTAQEQGVELFEMIEKQLYVERNKGFLDSQLKNLYDVADSIGEKMERKEERRLNIMLAAFALPGLILSVLQLILPMVVDISSPWSCRLKLIINSIELTVFSVLIVLIIYFISRIVSWRKQRKYKINYN